MRVLSEPLTTWLKSLMPSKSAKGSRVELSYTSSNSSALLEPSEVRENLDFTLVVKFVGETWKWASPISAKMGGSVINE